MNSFVTTQYIHFKMHLIHQEITALLSKSSESYLPSKCCQDALWQKQQTGHVHRQFPLRENT